MSDLHWLYVHGVVVEVAFVGTAILLGASTARWLARRSARERAVTAQSLMGEPARRADANGTMTLDGVLVREDGETTPIEIDARAHRTVVAPPTLGLRLTDGAIVAIPGPIHVYAGSFEGRRRARLDIGDHVRIRGRVVCTPSQSQSGYREAASEMHFEGAVALAANPTRVEASVPALGSSVTTAAVVSLLALMLLGSTAQHEPPGDGRRLTLHTLAAATPWRRFALRELGHQLESEPRETSKLRRAVDAFRLGGDCGHAASLMLSLGDTAAGEQIARTCPPMSGDAFLALGEVHMASRAYVQRGAVSLAACSTHIAAQRFAEAATCVRSLAVEREHGDNVGTLERRQGLTCIADALDVRGGHPEAMESLRHLVNRPAMCRVLLGDVLEGGERLALFSSAWEMKDSTAMDFTRSRVAQTELRLIEEVTGPRHGIDSTYAIDPSLVLAPKESGPPQNRSSTPVCLLAAIARAPIIPENAYGYRATVAGNIAQFQATLDETEAARRELELVRNDTRMFELLAAPIEQMRIRPSLGSRFVASRERADDGTIWATLDALAAARREDRTVGLEDVNGPAVRRLRDAVLARPTCVPLHMLQAFDDRFR